MSRDDLSLFAGLAFGSFAGLAFGLLVWHIAFS
jgi:tetrahydromethanopterin S-methyltransferase subunit F